MLDETMRHANGLELNVAERRESGPVLMLLHGVLRGWIDFQPLLPVLTERWCVHAVDLRGHGRSSHGAGTYRVVDYVADIVALVRQHDRPVVLYGHSLGAMVALGAAATLGEQVTGLVLEDPPFHTMGRDIFGTAFHSQFAGLQRIVRPGRTVDELWSDLRELPIQLPGRAEPVPFGQLRDAASLRFMARCLSRLDPAVLAPIAAGTWLDDYDWPALVDAVTCPTLVLQADSACGGMLTNSDAALLAARLRRGAVLPFPGIGHLIHWQATEWLARVAVPFLESLRD